MARKLHPNTSTGAAELVEELTNRILNTHPLNKAAQTELALLLHNLSAGVGGYYAQVRKENRKK